ncbi:MAG: helix-turn-helix domain-containing protein [Gemmatimonadota bacterium]
MSIEAVRSPSRAACLIAHPLRARILAQAREPISASDLARAIGQPRQRVNYHVRQLARHGFLVAVAQQKKRNMLEQQYIASARAYVLTPDVLGGVAPEAAAQDTASATELVALCGRAQSEVADVIDAAHNAGVRVRTFSLETAVHFESAQQRAEFTRALTAAVNSMVVQHSTPENHGSMAPTRPFRLIIGCYPIPGTPAPRNQ